MKKEHALSLFIRDWKKYLIEKGYPEYYGKSIFSWLHEKKVEDPQKMSDLPKKLRDALQEDFSFSSLTLVGKKKSIEDQVVKFLWRRENGSLIESVWLPYPNRISVCISVQSGCTLDCSFCATGKLPFRGNLSRGEMLEQVYKMQKIMGIPVKNVVFMGMGEPFYNYENSIKAAHLLHHPFGLQLGKRRITLSTVGIFPRIKQFVEEKEPFQLAISVHALFPKKREELMPIERKYPILEILEYLYEKRKLLRKNQLTIEYILIPGWNMYPEDAKRLIYWAKRLNTKVNLIPLNTSFEGFRRPTQEEIDAFWYRLYQGGILVFNRRSPGYKIQAACGQLAATF